MNSLTSVYLHHDITIFILYPTINGKYWINITLIDTLTNILNNHFIKIKVHGHFRSNHYKSYSKINLWLTCKTHTYINMEKHILTCTKVTQNSYDNCNYYCIRHLFTTAPAHQLLWRMLLSGYSPSHKLLIGFKALDSQTDLQLGGVKFVLMVDGWKYSI